MGNWYDNIGSPEQQNDVNQQGQYVGQPNPYSNGQSFPQPQYGQYGTYGQQGQYGAYGQQWYGTNQYGGGYGNVPVGRVDNQGFVHYSRMQYIEGLRNYVMYNTGKQITLEEKLDDTPDLLRHACAPAKISKLARLSFNVPETGVSIPFYFCTACGKLFYARDFM